MMMETYHPEEKKWKTHALSGMFWSLLSLEVPKPSMKFWITTNWRESRPDEPGTFLVFIPGDKNRTFFQETGGIRNPSEWCRILMWQPPEYDVDRSPKNADGLTKMHAAGKWQEFYSRTPFGSGISIATPRKWEKPALPVGVLCNTQLPVFDKPRPNLVVPAVLARQVWNDAMSHSKVPALWSSPPWTKTQVLPSTEPGTFVSHEGQGLLKHIRSLVMGMKRSNDDWMYDEED